MTRAQDLYMNDATRKHRKKHGAIERVHVEGIKVGKRMRPAGDVRSLKKSIATDGLRTPISVMVTRGENGDSTMELMAGARRLKACIALGWEFIPAFVYIREEGDTTEAKLWEVVENLQREELTTEQRDEHVRVYAELVDKRAKEQRKAGEIKGKVNIAKTVAEDLGVSRGTVQRALSPERKEREKEKDRARRPAGERPRTEAPATPAQPTEPGDDPVPSIPGHTSSKDHKGAVEAAAEINAARMQDEGNTEDGHPEEGTEGPTVTVFTEAAAKLAAKKNKPAPETLAALWKACERAGLAKGQSYTPELFVPMIERGLAAMGYRLTDRTELDAPGIAPELGDMTPAAASADVAG